MTTARQLTANRRNAAKSTGPRTQTGKAAVALNGMNYGLFTREVAIEGERTRELIDFGKRLRSQLAPFGELEVILADRIVATSWRLKRVVRVEAALFDEVPKITDAVGGWRGKSLGVLSRYEATLERSLHRSLEELRGLQGERTDAATRATPPLQGEVVDRPRELALPLSGTPENQDHAAEAAGA